MEHVSPEDYKLTDDYRAAIADADPNPYQKGNCGNRGPGGECSRERGHTDGQFYQNNNHVSYDSDNYMAWPVGLNKRIAEGKCCPSCYYDLTEE